MRKLFALLVAGGTAAAALDRPSRVAPEFAPPSRPVAGPVVEVAPPPREVDDDRVPRAGIAQFARPQGWKLADGENGVEWEVSLDVGELPGGGGSAIQFHWTLWYVGPRQPLVILPTSLSGDRAPKDTTQVTVYAFAKGRRDGRMVTISTSEPADQTLEWPPADRYRTVRKGRTASGVVSVPVSDVKALLRRRHPAEYAGDEPPALYVKLYHSPTARGWAHHLDAWTGYLSSATLEVPPLKGW